MKQEETFEEYWKRLDDEQREDIKKLVIERIKSMPDNLRLCIG